MSPRRGPAGSRVRRHILRIEIAVPADYPVSDLVHVAREAQESARLHAREATDVEREVHLTALALFYDLEQTE